MKRSTHGCEITELLHDGRSSSVFRARRLADGLPVVLKLLKEERPPPSQVIALRHEHEFLRGIDAEGVVRAHGLSEDQGHWALVLEDFGASSLGDLGLAGKLDLETFLRVAIRMTDSLGALHQHRVVHKDINPSNIVMNPSDGRVKLIDFGIATVLSQESPSFGTPALLEGTLPYVSPEQTGRMNRALDYRSDYYSLGVTLYELLTGHCPFETDDPLELVHCHIARRPPSPCERRAGIPEVVADIVLRLMAKNADERYQSVRGLRSDLTTCLEDVQRSGAVGSFPLGRHDASEHFRFPQKLYGRDEEIRRIHDTFQRASDGAAVCMTVSGDSGIGKSVLIQEVHRPLTGQRGYFLTGKFSQIRSTVPYGALVQALRSLVEQVLTEREERLRMWREEILATIGSNARLLIEICPPVERMTGPQPELPNLPPSEARHRFNLAMMEFLCVFARPEHPLCMFLDDLQWADADSLKFLEELMRRARELPLLLICAYRDNEIDEAHPLLMTLRGMEEQGLPIERLVLAPLGLMDIQSMVADALLVPASEGAPLAEILFSRTGGNPYFLRTFLASMHADGLLKFTQEGWRWDMDGIRQRGVTENVVDLLVARMQRLPQATQDALMLAACVGSMPDLKTLGIAAGRTSSEIGGDLWPAVVEGLLIPLGQVHSAVEMASLGQSTRLKFAHDRIQEALISMIDAEDRPGLYREAGRRLLYHLGSGELLAGLFDIVGMLNQGRMATESREELVQLARLNLSAARKALESGASQQALGYAQAGISLLDEDDWQHRYELALELHATGAEAALASGAFETLERLAGIVLARARSVLDEVRIRRIQGLLYLSRQQLLKATQVYLGALDRLGFGLPQDATPKDVGEEMGAVAGSLGGRPIEEIADLPECTEPATRAAMEILSQLILTAGITLANLFPIAVGRLVRLSLQFGNVPQSSLGYTSYGMLLTFGNQIEEAYRFGRLALRLADRFNDKGLRSQAYVFSYYFLVHWRTPLHDLHAPFTDAYRYAMEAGSPFNASMSLLNLSISRWLAGSALGDLLTEMKRHAKVIARFRQEQARTSFEIYQQTAMNLVDESADPCRLTGPIYDESRRVAQQEAANDAGGLFNYFYCKGLLSYLFGDFRAAASCVDANQPLLAVMGTGLHAAPLALLDSLCRLALHPQASEEERARILESVAASVARLASWLPYCPQTYEHKLRLIEAERHRVLGEHDQAEAAFAEAVELAKKSGYTHEEAIACELAGRYHLDRGDGRRGRSYLRQAHEAYLRWGALAKVRAMEQKYPRLVPRVGTGSLGTSITAGGLGEGDVNVLDLISVLDASQTLSREITRERLLGRLMELLIENSGAEAGCLLMEREGRWVMEAEKTVDREEAAVRESIPVEELAARGRRGVPEAVLNYVARTRESVVLDDAAASPHYGRDPHIAGRGVRSLLCFPLSRQAGRPSIVYLENNLVTGAFTPGRIRLLQLLSTQAVISLENALLYETLEQKVLDRTRELAEKNEVLGRTLKRLRETQQQLITQEKLASLGALTAGIAHEIKNPLHFINNFAEVSVELAGEAAALLGAQAERLDAGAAEGLMGVLADLGQNVSRINEHGRCLNSIVSGMLLHARESSGQREEVDLNALIGESLSLAQHGVRAKYPELQLAIQASYDPAVGRVEVVAPDISRVLINLINNACYALREKARAAGPGFSPTLSVATRAAGERIEVRIRDNGTGIPREILHRIFNPFFTTKPPGEGTGLGLSICHDIVAGTHKGEIRVGTEEGEFSEFVIDLPRRSA